jgi:hypothetical protein
MAMIADRLINVPVHHRADVLVCLRSRLSCLQQLWTYATDEQSPHKPAGRPEAIAVTDCKNLLAPKHKYQRHSV